MVAESTAEGRYDFSFPSKANQSNAPDDADDANDTDATHGPHGANVWLVTVDLGGMAKRLITRFKLSKNTTCNCGPQARIISRHV